MFWEGLFPFNPNTIEDFFRFVTSISHAIIDKKGELIIGDSTIILLEWSFAIFARVTGNRIEEGRQTWIDFRS